MKIICKKCDGEGWYPERRDFGDYFLAPLTLGLSLIRRKIFCKVCDGVGWYSDDDPEERSVNGCLTKFK